VSQGVEMGRPSEIFLEVQKAAGVVESISVAGKCVHVIEGILTI
jgi:predicted PhzF superfamily epimerase YddE/YHI9